VLKKFNQIIGIILATKLMTWALPDSKRFIKGISITTAAIILIIYFHDEYLKWVELSGNLNFLTFSYFIKNIIILVLFFILFFYLKKPKKKTSSRVKGEEKIYTKYSGDAYFDKFRNKEKLRTKGEQILKKNDKN
jgi:predicted membrane protein